MMGLPPSNLCCNSVRQMLRRHTVISRRRNSWICPLLSFSSEVRTAYTTSNRETGQDQAPDSPRIIAGPAVAY